MLSPLCCARTKGETLTRSHAPAPRTIFQCHFVITPGPTDNKVARCARSGAAQLVMVLPFICMGHAVWGATS